MLGLFGTLNLAARSLQTQMAGVETAGQNLANVNTPGYSRQQVVIQTSPAVQTGVGPQGTGANLVAIQQVTDALLNGQILDQGSISGFWNSNQSALDTMQSALNEFLNSTQGAAGSTTTSSSGLSDKLSAFFNAFQAVATSPTSISARQALIGQAQTLATTFNQLNSRFDSLHTALDTSLTSQVDSANQLLSDIANLNGQIQTAENYTGGVANDLRDMRQQKLESLSKLINFQSSTGANGMIDITVGGSLSLVSGNQVVDSLKTDDPGNTGQLLVYTATGNALVTPLTGGSMAGTIDARDGTLADMKTSINALASNLITQVNTLHSAGFSLTGSTGANFFSGADASDIAVNQSLADDPSLIQAAGTSGAIGDNSVALALAQLASAAQAGLSGKTFSASYAQTVAKLGNALKNANDQVDSQTAVTKMLSNQRSSVSGVNLDEEMTNLMTFQRAYQASAHLVSTVDQMIQTILAMKNP
jgi:flagellar hook-associated protein 1 FlgK